MMRTGEEPRGGIEDGRRLPVRVKRSYLENPYKPLQLEGFCEERPIIWIMLHSSRPKKGVFENPCKQGGKWTLPIWRLSFWTDGSGTTFGRRIKALNSKTDQRRIKALNSKTDQRRIKALNSKTDQRRLDDGSWTTVKISPVRSCGGGGMNIP